MILPKELIMMLSIEKLEALIKEQGDKILSLEKEIKHLNNTITELLTPHNECQACALNEDGRLCDNCLENSYY